MPKATSKVRRLSTLSTFLFLGDSNIMWITVLVG
jgi:hypothetical protein